MAGERALNARGSSFEMDFPPGHSFIPPSCEMQKPHPYLGLVNLPDLCVTELLHRCRPRLHCLRLIWNLHPASFSWAANLNAQPDV